MEMDKRLDYTSPAFKRIWDFFFEAAVRGHFTAFDGYASDHFKTGESFVLSALLQEFCSRSRGDLSGQYYGINGAYGSSLSRFLRRRKNSTSKGSRNGRGRTDERKANAAAIFLKCSQVRK
jgi:hypothetical protein